ncbi:MAG: hypothetical protein ABI863_04655 [Ginsengibacter sp.]
MKKFSMRILIIIFLPCVLCMYSCTQRANRIINRSFYYWKSVYKLTDYEKNNLNNLHVSTLYIKLFDVTWDKQTNRAIPAAQIQFKDTSHKLFATIPVVFITNETLINTDSAGIKELTEKICKLLSGIINQNFLNKPREIQFDCDWTITTKEKYFQLLKLARVQLNESGFSSATISATIRLYQCRYLYKTGVPPVDKGMLMCYNMGDLKNPGTKNSILESDELKKYILSLNRYPLPLDVAFPLFDWKVLFHDNIFTGLVKELPDSLLQHTSSVIVHNNRYTFLKDTIIENYSFKKGDMLREEQSDYDEIINAGKLIRAELKTRSINVLLYHLDSLTLSKYTPNEMENMFDCLH